MTFIRNQTEEIFPIRQTPFWNTPPDIFSLKRHIFWKMKKMTFAFIKKNHKIICKIFIRQYVHEARFNRFLDKKSEIFYFESSLGSFISSKVCRRSQLLESGLIPFVTISLYTSVWFSNCVYKFTRLLKFENILWFIWYEKILKTFQTHCWSAR